MSFTVENLEEKNMVKLVIESTAEEFEAGLNTAYNKNKSKISLPGFRKGKAPRKMIEKMYGAEVFYEDAANSIIPDAYAKAADECGLELVSQPKINVTQLEAGKPFIFEAVVATKPEVELGQYKGVEVTKADTEATDADVEEELKKELDILKTEHQGSLLLITARGTRREIMEKIQAKNPLFCEVLPLTLEEIFISETEVAGYEVKNIFW